MRKFIHEYIHYNNGTIVDNGWWELIKLRDGTYIRQNMVGGYHPHCDLYPEETIVEANDWEDLDWSILLRPDSPYGWINLEGEFFGCDYMEHDRLARFYFKSDEQTLERIGWVKIYRNYNYEIAYYVIRHLTEQQEATLLERGIKL